MPQNKVYLIVVLKGVYDDDNRLLHNEWVRNECASTDLIKAYEHISKMAPNKTEFIRIETITLLT